MMATAIAPAQTTTATLYGVVRDVSGAIVPDAQVIATNVDTTLARTVATDDTGSYLITNLPVGSYRVAVEKAGFHKFVQSGITLNVNDHARVDVTLEVGQVSENVSVTAQAIGVDTQSTSMGGVVDNTRVRELPLNGRNVMELARTVPGVARTSAPTAVPQARGGPAIIVAGARDTENEMRFDGTQNKNPLQNTLLNLPSPDALQEFKVLTSSFSAEYGRFGGGLFIAVTRSGTNQLHGSAWEYLRNTLLNARNFFALDRADLKQNQFGGTVGGPIIRNKTFFFGSYQGTRIRQSQLFGTSRPPTSLERAGDFSRSSRLPTDPLTNQPFPGGVIPADRFDPVAVKLLQRYIPLPNTSDGRYVALAPRPTDAGQYLVKVDHSFSSNNTLNLRYFRDTTDLFFQTGDTPGYVVSLQHLPSTNWALVDTHIFSPALLNEFRIGIERFDSPTTAVGHTQLSDFGANYPGVIIPQLPNINTSGFFSLGSNDIFRDTGNIYQIGNTLRWQRGRHSVSFGGEYERTEYLGRGWSSNQGTFTFDGSITRVAFADFLLGKPASLDQSSPYERLEKGYDWYVFAQDDFRISSRLTANLGVRYQIFHPYRAIYDRVNTFRAGAQSTVVKGAPPGMLFPGDPGVTNTLLPTDTNNVSPRVGLAWDPFGNGRLSVRAAYGLFFEDDRTDPWIYPAVNQPFVIRKVIFNPFSFSDPYRGQENPFPYIYTPQNARFSFPMGLSSFASPDIRSPYVHHASFSIEKSLPANTVVSVGYIGKFAHNLLHMNQSNPAVYIPGKSTTSNTDQRRIILPGIYSSMRTIEGNSNSAYHGLQFVVNKRLSHGVTVLASYTFSKFLDYYSATNLGQFVQNPYDERADRSLSDEDRTHVFNASFYYEIPFRREGHGLLGKTLGAWTASGIVSHVSGAPINILSGQDYSLTGVGWDRPDLIGDPRISYADKNAMLNQYFNPAAFAPNQPGRYGNVGRNLLTGPSQNVTNLSLVKAFPISERWGKLQLRGEFFNLFNHTNFGLPEARINNRNVGKISSSGDPRIMQFALRYLF
jgi:hypothetical protein